MSEWQEYKLGDLYDVSSGLSKPADQFGFGHTFISFKDVFNNYFIPEYPEGLVNSNDKDWKSCSVKKGDILITRTSETIEEVGMSSVALKDYEKSTFNGFCKRLRLKGNTPIKVSPHFMGYLLRTRFFRKTVANFATMTTRASLNGESIKSIPLKFPPFEIQEEIGKTLYSLEKKISLLQEQNQTLEELAQTLFKRWFVEFEFPNETRQPYKNSGGKMVESELGKIPEGWQLGTIEDLTIRMSSGGTPSTKNEEYYNGSINWFSTKELQDNFLLESEKQITLNAIENSSAKLFPKNTILMAIYAAPTVGRLGILSFESAFNQAAVGLVAKSEVGYPFVFLLLKHLRKELNNLANGAAQQNLNVGLVKGFKIIIPAGNILSHFNELALSLFNQIQNNSTEMHTLSLLRDTLLPKLMSGELKLKELA